MRAPPDHKPSESLILRAALDNASSLVYAKGVDGRLIYSNARACEALGISVQDYFDQDGRLCFDPDTVAETTEVDRRVLLTGERIRLRETVTIKSSGRKVTFSTVKFPILDEDQQIVGICGISTDVSDRQPHDADLTAYQQLLDTVLNGVAADITMKSDDRKYVYVNRRACESVNYSLHEIVGKSDDELFPREIAQQMREVDDRVFETGEPQYEETQFRNSDGEIRYRWTTRLLVRRAGQSDCLVALSTDITAIKLAQAALVRSEARFRRLFHGSNDALMVLNREHFLDCNDATLRVFGVPDRETFRARGPADLSPPLQPCGTPSAVLAAQHIKKAFAQDSHRFDWVHRRADTGEEMPCEVILRVIEMDEETVLLATVHDLTERMRAESTLRESEEKFRLAFSDANIGMCLLDLRGVLTQVNDKMCEILGYGRMEIEGLNVADLAIPEDRYLTAVQFDRALVEGLRRITFEKRYRHRDGHVVFGVVTSSLVRDSQGEPRFFISQVQDLSDTKRAELQLRAAHEATDAANRALARANAELKKLAATDELTGVWNRRYLEMAAKAEIARAARRDEPLSILMFDIDHFKEVNDTFGHAVGDEILVALTNLMQECLRPGDILARWGGEEFMLILPNCVDRDAMRLAEKLRRKCAAHLFQDVGKVTVSFGVTQLLPGENREAWFRRVDRAMYAAKAAGRNTVRCG